MEINSTMVREASVTLAGIPQDVKAKMAEVLPGVVRSTDTHYSEEAQVASIAARAFAYGYWHAKRGGAR